MRVCTLRCVSAGPRNKSYLCRFASADETCKAQAPFPDIAGNAPNRLILVMESFPRQHQRRTCSCTGGLLVLSSHICLTSVVVVVVAVVVIVVVVVAVVVAVAVVEDASSYN